MKERKNNMKIVLSLLVVVSFIATSVPVIGMNVGNSVPTEKINANAPTTSTQMPRIELGYLDRNTGTYTPLNISTLSHPVDITPSSITIYINHMEGPNEANGLLPTDSDLNTDYKWIRIGGHASDTMTGQLPSYAHYTTYQPFDQSKCLCNFQEITTTSFPFRYYNYGTTPDWVMGPRVLRAWMKNPFLKLQATVQFKYSIGPTDSIRLGVLDLTLGHGYFYVYTGQSLIWNTITLPVYDMINAWPGGPNDKYCLTVLHTKGTPFQNYYSSTDEWSGWMLDKIVWTIF